MSILNYRLQGDHFSDLVAIEQANILIIMNSFIHSLNVYWAFPMALGARHTQWRKYARFLTVVSSCPGERGPVAAPGRWTSPWWEWAQLVQRPRGWAGVPHSGGQCVAALQTGPTCLSHPLPWAPAVHPCHFVWCYFSSRRPSTGRRRTSKRTAARRRFPCRKWCGWQIRAPGNWDIPGR